MIEDINDFWSSWGYDDHFYDFFMSFGHHRGYDDHVNNFFYEFWLSSWL
ncbi:hypothetical protein [Bacillus sp. OK048]|nr:hypothetical protein [Bacillus sp. OK048]